MPGGKQEHGTHHDARLGTLTATFRTRDTWCDWQGSHLLEGQPEKTLFSVSGSPAGPDPHLLAAIYRVLDELESIAVKANERLERIAPGATLKDFYLSRIGDWEQVDEILQVELRPRGESVLQDDVTIYWPGDDELSNHHLVLRAVRTV